MKNEDIKELIYNKFITKNGDKGYTNEELIQLKEQIIKDNPYFSEKKMQESLFGNTVAVINDEYINYKHDVLTAIKCGLENRSMTFSEWD